MNCSGTCRSANPRAATHLEQGALPLQGADDGGVPLTQHGQALELGAGLRGELPGVVNRAERVQPVLQPQLRPAPRPDTRQCAVTLPNTRLSEVEGVPLHACRELRRNPNIEEKPNAGMQLATAPAAGSPVRCRFACAAGSGSALRITVRTSRLATHAGRVCAYSEQREYSSICWYDLFNRLSVCLSHAVSRSDTCGPALDQLDTVV